MRPQALLATLCLSLTSPAVLAAQGDIRLGLGAGVTMPVRSYADFAHRGWAGMANLTYFPGASAALGFRLDALYTRNSLSITSGTQTQIGGLANLVFQFGARRSPNRLYVFGGGGYLRARSTGPDFGQVTSTEPALNLGAGVSFGARAVALYLEARYVSVKSQGIKPQYTPVMVGVSFGGF